jgi:hypothetical protein
MADEALEPMDVEVYENQFKPWLGEDRFRWADEHTRPGPPGLRLVPRALRDAFLHRVNQRAITDAEEKALGLPWDEPDWDQRDIYSQDPR